MPSLGRSFPILARTLRSFSWLVAEKVFRLAVGIFVMAWVARYLGPEQFGAWNHALAFTFLFSALAGVGLDSVVVRELIAHPHERPRLLGCTLAIRLISGVAAVSMAVLIISLAQPGDREALILVTICALGFIFQAGQFAEFDFQTRQENRYPAAAQFVAFATMTAAKIALLLTGAPLIAFAICGTLEIAISMIMIVCFLWSRTPVSLAIDRPTIISLLRAGVYPALSGLTLSIYLRLDQVLISAQLGDGANGIYAAAIRLGECWYFVPVAIATSVLPLLIKEHLDASSQVSTKTILFFDAMSLLGYLACLGIILTGPLLIRLLYGDRYVGAEQILVLHSLAAVFVTLGVAVTTWLTSRGLLGYGLVRTCVGCAIGVSLNLLLIPRLGITGAAIAIIASQAGSTCCLVCFPATRPIGWQILSSLLPWSACLRLSRNLRSLRPGSP